jgi:N-hydroxyarylamine O-acetyltransferase
VILGRGIAVDSDGVFAKLVTAKRGGYCFEHNRLFGDALDALGFDARPLLGRVWINRPDAVPNRTHALSLVTIDGQEWIADTGFGGAFCPPMPLADGEEATGPDGARHRLARDPVFGWMLERDGHPLVEGAQSKGWQKQYSFTLDEVFPADLEMANWWTSTSPASRFRNVRLASLVLPHGFAALTERRYHRRAGESATAGTIDDPRVYRMRLSLLFGIDLSAEDVAALGLFETR